MNFRGFSPVFGRDFRGRDALRGSRDARYRFPRCLSAISAAVIPLFFEKEDRRRYGYDLLSDMKEEREKTPGPFVFSARVPRRFSGF